MNPHSYSIVPHKQYGYPHGATSPQTAALLTQKHQAHLQNKAIHGSGRTRRRRRTKSRLTYRRRRPSTIRKRRKSRKSRKTRSRRRRRSSRTRKGGNTAINVPHFSESPNPVSPVGANSLSKSSNSSLLQGKANAKYDNMYSAPPRKVDSF